MPDPFPKKSRLTYTLLIGSIVLLASPLHSEIRIVLATGASIGLIILDERTHIENRIEQKLKVSVREFWVPILLLCELLFFNLIDLSTLATTTRDKADIVAFIMAFALIAEGLRDSGLVTFLAYRFAERCGGNTHRLILYLFVLASALTYLTSNDIVVLALTPIIFSVAMQARIHNARMLLLAQFVAANTISMGLLIGSPTNIIIGDILDINFLEYALIMALPAVYSFIISFIVVDLLNVMAERSASRSVRGIRRLSPANWSSSLPDRWTFQRNYTPPIFADYRSLTVSMKRWLSLFALGVIVLAFNTLVDQSLYYTAITIAAGSVLLRRYERTTGEESTSSARHTLLRLPFGIIPFGLVFFAIADRLSQSSVINETIVPFLNDVSKSGSPIPSLMSIFGSGVIVNILNDLPASALTGEIVSRATFAHELDEMQAVVGVLTGVNIGTYVTPIGALAGLIWFGILRRMHHDVESEGGPTIEVPQRQDLIIYGTICFVLSTISLSVVHYAWIGIVNFIIGPSDHPGRIDAFGPWYVSAPAVIFMAAIPLLFHRRLAHHGVTLLHMADLFAVVTRVRFWILANRIKFIVLAASVLFVSSAGSLFAVEMYSAQVYDADALFSNATGFLSWFSVFITSGFEQELFPRSLGGVIIGAVSALGSIGTLVYLGRVASDEPMRRLRGRIASGVIPSQRILLMNVTSDHIALIEQLLKRTNAFIVCIAKPEDIDRLETTFYSRPSRGFVIDGSMMRPGIQTFQDRGVGTDVQTRVDNPDELLLSLDPLSVDHIFLLSSCIEDDLMNVSAINLMVDVANEALAVGARPGLMELPADHLSSFPEILCQISNDRSLELVEGGAREQLVTHVSKLTDDNCFGRYLYSEVRGPIDYVDEFYSIESASTRVQFENDLRLVHATIAEPIHPSSWDMPVTYRDKNIRKMLLDHLRESAGLPDDSVVCGVEVLIGGNVERLALGTYLRDTRVGSVCGVVAGQVSPRRSEACAVNLVEKSGSDGNLLTSKLRYVVVGSSPAAVDALRGLANAPGIDLRFVCSTSVYVPSDISVDGRILVSQFELPSEASRKALDMSGPGGRMLIFDDDSARNAWIDRFLESLSEMRLDMDELGRDRFVGIATRHSWKVSSFQNFFADEVIDTSWFLDSYFRIFTTILYETIGRDERFGREARTHMGMEIAHEIAIGLRQFVAIPFGDLEMISSNREVLFESSHVPMPTFVRNAELADNPTWEIVGVARVSLEGDANGRLDGATVELLPNVREEVDEGEVNGESAGLVRESDIVLGIPYL